jgi:hypothetical protein
MERTINRGRLLEQYDAPSWSVTIVGVLFAVTGIAYLLTHPAPISVWAIELALVSVPAAGIIYGGYWVATRQLRLADRWSIATWGVVGGVVAGLLIAVYVRTEQAGGTAVADAELLVLIGAMTGTAVSLFAAISNERRHLPSEFGTVDERQLQTVESKPLSADARVAADLLSDTRSWHVLRVLSLVERPLGVETVAERVATIEGAAPDDVYVDLLHARLPKLEANGLIRYESDVGVVHPTERIETVANASEELTPAGQTVSEPNP